MNRETSATALSVLAGALGVAAIATRPFLLAPIGLLCLLTATKLSAGRRTTGVAAAVLALGALTGAAVAVGFTQPLY